jgi:hypothetical protein
MSAGAGVEDGAGCGGGLLVVVVVAQVLVLPGAIPESLLQEQLAVSRVQNLQDPCALVEGAIGTPHKMEVCKISTRPKAMRVRSSKQFN